MWDRILVLPVVLGLLEENGKILLGKRGQRPYKSCWDLPGGVVKDNEDLFSALRREYGEETELEVNNAVLKNVFHYPGNEGSRAIFVLFAITSYSGQLSPSREFPILKFFNKNLIMNMVLTPWTEHFLYDLFGS